VLDSAGKIFAWQHDPEQVGRDTFTFFDNDSTGTPLLSYSRAVTVRLSYRSRIATLVAADNQPEALSAASQGDAQVTRNGDLFVGCRSVDSPRDLHQSRNSKPSRIAGAVSLAPRGRGNGSGGGRWNRYRSRSRP